MAPFADLETEASTSPRPRLVLLVGEPGSGKTTLGFALSRALGIPFLARDQVRRGQYLTASALGTGPASMPTSERAVEGFLTSVGTLAGLGVSCVVEYVFRAARPGDLQRLIDVADCIVVRTSCADAPARRSRRDREDALLSRAAVAKSLGFRDAAHAEAARAARMARVTEAMMTTFPLPVLEVTTDDGWDPSLETIIERVIAPASPTANAGLTREAEDDVESRLP